MIRKSGSRFSEKIMLRLKHDPEKWKPVFRKDHVGLRRHGREQAAAKKGLKAGKKGRLVEPRGVEPLTSSLRTRRSPN
jgi:hypothetical protein